LLPFLLLSTVSAERIRQSVNITGERMEILKKGEIIRFLGNVKLVRGKDIVTCDMMEHYEKNNYVIGKGDVHLVTYPEESMRLEAFSDGLKYDVKSEESVLTGNPRLIRFNEQNSLDKLKVEGEVIRLSGKEKIVFVEGDARVERGEIIATSKFLDYNYQTKKIILSGGPPRIFQNHEKATGEYSAKTITIFLDRGIVAMEENVNASIYPKYR